MAQFTITSTDTVPQGTALTGTVTAFDNSRVISGSGTSFLAEVDGGDWIHDRSGDQMRQVDYVVSDTEIILRTAFGSAISAGTVYVAKGDLRQISIAANGGNIATRDGEDNASTIIDGSSITPLPKSSGAVSPIIVKATTAASAICSTTE